MSAKDDDDGPPWDLEEAEGENRADEEGLVENAECGDLEDIRFDSTPLKEIETRSDIADDGEEMLERRVSFVVPIPPAENEDKPQNVIPEFKTQPLLPPSFPSASSPAPKSHLKERPVVESPPPKVEVRTRRAKSELPLPKTNLTVEKKVLDSGEENGSHGGAGKDFDHRHQPYLHAAGMHGHTLQYQQHHRRAADHYTNSNGIHNQANTFELTTHQEHPNDYISRSATPIQLTLPSGFERTTNRLSRPASGNISRTTNANGTYDPISFETEILEDVPEVYLRPRSRANGRASPSRPQSRAKSLIDEDDTTTHKKHALTSLRPHEIPFNPFPLTTSTPPPTAVAPPFKPREIGLTGTDPSDNIPSHGKTVQYQDGVEDGRSPSRMTAHPRPHSEASVKPPGTAHAYCLCSRPGTPSSPTAAAAATVPKTQTVRTNIDKYRIEQIALRRLRFVIENSQAEPEHLSIMNLVETGNVPRSLFIRFFGPKHQTAHDVRVLLLQSIERTARIRTRLNRRHTQGGGSPRRNRERTISPWNRNHTDQTSETTHRQNKQAETDGSALDPKVIAKHAREVAIHDVKSRRGVRTPGDLLTILNQVDRKAQAVREGRSRLGHKDETYWGKMDRVQTATTGVIGSTRKSFGLTRNGPPPPPELCAEFERLLELEERKFEDFKQKKNGKARAEERKKLGKEPDEDMDSEEATRAYLRDLDLDGVTGNPEVRRKASLILSEAHMLRVIQRRKTKHLLL
ncbi:hypothetical protein HDU67_009268 [Dinochytrium kinnereticum]|nr:hypothetical protein HDU67_009268 [Dinochytrium kinnereticum]